MDQWNLSTLEDLRTEHDESHLASDEMVLALLADQSQQALPGFDRGNFRTPIRQHVDPDHQNDGPI